MKSDDIGRRIGHHSAHRGAQSDISRTELFAIYSAGAQGAFCGQGNQYGKSCIQFKEKSWR